jgi:hypothetical protein
MLKGGRDCEFYHRYGSYVLEIAAVPSLQTIYFII